MAAPTLDQVLDNFQNPNNSVILVPNVDPITFAVGVTDDHTPTLAGTADPGSTVLLHYFYFDALGNPVDGLVPDTIVADASGNWHYEFTVSLDGLSVLTGFDGTYTFIAETAGGFSDPYEIQINDVVCFLKGTLIATH